ncbi:MAG: RES family NAD+ phosphorylase [Synergistaceae bacterium]|jgi:hypothetical protein|nr:RES family NAD+ phosphorylase [Synergistaceae bacterium]
MNCCVECFADAQIREIIASSRERGNCDFCGRTNVKLHPIVKNGDVETLLESVLDIYSVSPSAIEGQSLRTALRNDWDIFAVPSDVVQKLIIAMCPDQLAKNEKLFSSPIYIPEFRDQDYLSETGITTGHSWNEFSETIKFENRFHSHIFNQDAFVSFLTFAKKVYPAGSKMFRARICKDKNGFPTNEMGTPPRGLRASGRINPEGVSVLYLSTRDETALYEVRAGLYDFVTVGDFVLQKDIQVVNLAGIGSISPFIYAPEAEADDLRAYAINRPCLREIAAEIAKPLRRNDSPLEYLPTQYISEFIKSQKYEGVEYASTMSTDGYNIAVFDESLFECVGTHVYEIANLSYNRKPL